MFRYIAIAWDPTVPHAAALAGSLVATMGAQSQWRQELGAPRIKVFTIDTVPGTNQAYPLHDQRGVVLGRLFLQDEPQASTDRVTQRLAMSERVIATGGRDLLENCWGRYVAFFESPDGSIHVLRDPSGALPCFGLRHGGVTVVFSWLEDVLDLLPQIPTPEVCQQGLAAYMAFGELTGRRTALQGVTQVLAGERVPMHRIGDHVGVLVWDASSISSTPAVMDPADASALVRDTVTTCVQAWARCYKAILLRLSGGVDSSIVAACLEKGRTTARVTGLNYHSPGSDGDERPFARLAAASARLELIERERDRTIRLERVLDIARTPVPHPYVGRLTSNSDAEIAHAIGASALFTGAGGDQLFFEIPRWWPAADYLRLLGLDGGFAGAALDAARLGGLSVWRTVRLALADRFRKQPLPMDLHRSRTLISPAVWDQAARPEGFVHAVFTSPSKLPIGKLNQVHQLTYPPAYYDPFSRERAPEPVNPLLSQPVMELCLKIPTFVLTKGGRGRALARAAFQGEIPEAIANRRSKGGMGDHFDAVLAANLDFARDVLLNGRLVQLGLLDRAAVEKALCSRDAGDNTPAGEIHLAIGVEAWLRRAVQPGKAS